MTRRHTATWKHTERTIAQRLNATRTGNTGTATADAANAWLAIEAKHRAELPAWLKDATAQAQRNAGPGQLPIVVLHEAGGRHDGDLVVMTLADFQRLWGK